jgi:putative transport protein
MQTLLTEQLFILFAILAVGYGLGRVSIKGISLGTAGVLFAALIFGHFGRTVPHEVMELGLLLFVYAVGLQAGPRFFRTFRRQGLRFVIIGLVTVTAGALFTIGVAFLLDLPFDLASGLYTGALTCTPALAAAIDVADRFVTGHSAEISVGYGVAYPFSMIAMVLLMQFLPKLLRRNLAQEEKQWQEQQQIDAPTLKTRQFVVTNPNCEGRTLAEVNPGRMSQANISRVRRGDQVLAATPDIALQQGDIVLAVGTAEELDKLRLLLGEETQVAMDSNAAIASTDIVVTEKSATGRRLAELDIHEAYDVVITRIRRQGLEITPTGRIELEMGDHLRVVGERSAVERFAGQIGGERREADETNMLVFLLGLLLGIAVGAIPIPLPSGLTVRLGSAGGAFVVSLLLGHFGRIGRLRLYVPPAARNLSRELGLMLFLAGAGTNAGSRLVSVIQQQGWSLFLGGAVVTILSFGVGLLLLNWIYRMNLLATMGALCACMTNPPALGAATAQSKTDLPTLAYASVYPVALIFKIVLAQVLVEVLRLLL